MTSKQTNHGEIITPFGALPNDRELHAAQILTRTGKDAKFLPATLVKTADIIFNNQEWEIKSPIGKTTRAIERCLRKALKQSPNVILDLQYIGLDETKCLTYLQNHIHNFLGLKRMLIITKSEKILKISPKTACISELPVLK